MAQKPIGFYGKFTPTSIDNTVGDRFKALAGLSSEVGQTLLNRQNKQSLKLGKKAQS